MAAVKSRDTTPEISIRKALHSLGYRFRLHRKDLPGKPDIVLPKHMTCIFVHGCFWHQHSGCKRATVPENNREFWKEKFVKNLRRDEEARKALKILGWKVLVVWECEIKAEKSFEKIMRRFASTY